MMAEVIIAIMFLVGLGMYAIGVAAMVVEGFTPFALSAQAIGAVTVIGAFVRVGKNNP